MVLSGNAELRLKDNLITLAYVTRNFCFRENGDFERFRPFVNYLKSCQEVPDCVQRLVHARGKVDKVNSLHAGAAFGRLVLSVAGLTCKKIAELVQLFADDRNEVDTANFLNQFGRGMGVGDVILYYLIWIVWVIYNIVWKRCFGCIERFEVLFYDHETRDFADTFESWAWVYFKLIPWKPGQLWDKPIICVCEEKTRHIADMHGALENFSDSQLRKTMFVYSTNDTEKKFRMTKDDRYIGVPVICVSKEKKKVSANIFRKAVITLLVKYKEMTIHASELTPLTNT